MGEVPQPRSDHVAASVGGKIYVLGGYDGANIVADVGRAVVVHDRGGVPLCPLPSDRGHRGLDTSSSAASPALRAPTRPRFEQLDTATAAITVVGQLHGPLSSASAVQLGNEVFLLSREYVNNTQLTTGSSASTLRPTPRRNKDGSPSRTPTQPPS